MTCHAGLPRTVLELELKDLYPAKSLKPEPTNIVSHFGRLKEIGAYRRTC